MTDTKYMVDTEDWDLLYKKYAINICNNCHKYIKKYHYRIIDKNIQKICILLGSAYGDVEMMKLLVAKFGINEKYVDYRNNNCLLLACRYNKRLDVIIYLIDECYMNVDRINRSGHNCLSLACEYNTIDVVRYLVEACEMDSSNWCNRDCDESILTASLRNKNLEVVMYAMQNFEMIINLDDEEKDICVALACLDNAQLDVVKYLIETCNLDFNYVDSYGNNCLMWACEDPKLDVIKYLIESCKMNINHTNDNNENCLSIAWKYNKLDVIKYLIETYDININHLDECKTFDEYVQLVDIFHNATHPSISEILAIGYTRYQKAKMKKLTKKINPLLLMDNIRSNANIKNPFGNKYDYKKFKANVDDLRIAFYIT